MDGHRLYSVEQIPRLNKILYLRDSGLNVSEIALALTLNEQSFWTTRQKAYGDRKCNTGRTGKTAEDRTCKSEIQDGKGERTI